MEFCSNGYGHIEDGRHAEGAVYGPRPLYSSFERARSALLVDLYYATQTKMLLVKALRESEAR